MHEEILRFWFGKIGDNGHVPNDIARRWFQKNDSSDELVKQRFQDIHRKAHNQELEHWCSTTRGRLALIIVLDQFSRQIYRGSPQAFASDALALRHAGECIAHRWDLVLSENERAFMYLPFEHAESVEAQAESVQLFEQLAETATVDQTRMKNYVDYAIKHQKIVREFARFPHRNEILGRLSTPQELAFLKRPGSRF